MSDRQLVGDVTRLTIRKWKWQLGTGNDPFQDSQHHYPQDESQWLQSVRKFAVRYHIRLSTSGQEYPLQRVNDRYIMEWAEEMGFSHFELRFLNHCRLYLNVISISDITNELGKSIDPEFMTFKKLPERHPDSQINQSKPDHTKWWIWFKFIANITRKRQKYLTSTLGAWMVE